MGTWKFRATRHTDDVREFKLIRTGSFVSKWLVVAGFCLVAMLLTWPLWSTVQFFIFYALACTIFAILNISNLLEAREETLMVIREMGVQLGTTNWLGFRKTRFIEKKKIQSVIINEGIQSFQVLYYLAFILKDESKMVIPFQNVFPRMPVLLPIYRGVRAVLYGEPEDQDILETDNVFEGATQETYRCVPSSSDSRHSSGVAMSNPRLLKMTT